MNLVLIDIMRWIIDGLLGQIVCEGNVEILHEHVNRIPQTIQAVDQIGLESLRRSLPFGFLRWRVIALGPLHLRVIIYI